MKIFNIYFPPESATVKALQNLMDEGKKAKNIQNNFQFLRRGIVDSYKDELSEELVAKLDRWSAKFLEEANVTSDQVFCQ